MPHFNLRATCLCKFQPNENISVFQVFTNSDVPSSILKEKECRPFNLYHPAAFIFDLEQPIMIPMELHGSHSTIHPRYRPLHCMGFCVCFGFEYTSGHSSASQILLLHRLWAHTTT